MHGFGRHPKPFFWLIADGKAGENLHIAFTVPDRAAVRAFYDAAMAAGTWPRTDRHNPSCFVATAAPVVATPLRV